VAMTSHQDGGAQNQGRQGCHRATLSPPRMESDHERLFSERADPHRAASARDAATTSIVRAAGQRPAARRRSEKSLSRFVTMRQPSTKSSFITTDAHFRRRPSRVVQEHLLQADRPVVLALPAFTPIPILPGYTLARLLGNRAQWRPRFRIRRVTRAGSAGQEGTE
jgi:hypothetical protein